MKVRELPIIKVSSSNLSPAGKRLVASSMYEKGRMFLAASMLLREHAGQHFVALHLLGQGIENVLKGILLAIDYDKFRPQLKRDFGHDLLRTANAASSAAGSQSLGGPAKDQLLTLSRWYGKHALRYGTHLDLLVSADRLPMDRLQRRLVALMKLVGRSTLFPERTPSQ